VDPCGLVTDSAGNIFVVDAGNHSIRKISVSGEVSTLCGTGKPNYADGKGHAAAFNFPCGLAIGADGTLYVCDSCNHRVRTVTPGGEVRTLAGSGNAGWKDGSGHSAQFSNPTGIAVDGEGTVFVTDRGNHRVRKITSKGTVSTLAGSGNNAVADGKGAAASLSWPHSITIDPAAKGCLYVSDTFTFRIRRITRDGMVKTIAIGEAELAKKRDPKEPPPESNRVNTLMSLALDPVKDYLYVCEQSNHCIRRLSLASPVVYQRGA